MASNSSTKEKTIKSMYQTLSSDSWLIDKVILYGNYNNTGIIPVGNILDEYFDHFEQYLETVEIPEAYFYQPAAFAEYYYGTPDLDFIVLYFARMSTLFEFNRKKITALPRSRLMELNKLMTSYKKIVSDSYIDPTNFMESNEIEVQKKIYL